MTRSGSEPADDAGPGGSGTVGRALVVGTGLVGTSVGLALRAAGAAVWLVDADPAAVTTAAARGAGTPGPPDRPVDAAVFAVPPDRVAGAVREWQARLGAAVYLDTASVQTAPRRQAEHHGVDLRTYLGGHPMAGREVSGPLGARADLFVGRPWVLTPTAATDRRAVAVARGVVEACRAYPVLMDAARHDDAVALVSHVPHLLAGIVAARLADAPQEQVALAGAGVADVTRVAAGDPVLWTEILRLNAGPVAAVLDRVAADVDLARRALQVLAGSDETAGAAAEARDALAALLARGNAGRSRLPGKHGTRPAGYRVVAVLLPDRPGELARLFRAADRAGVNVEDVRIEHAPGQPVGVVQLAVAPGAAGPLADALRADGWTVP